MNIELRDFFAAQHMAHTLTNNAFFVAMHKNPEHREACLQLYADNAYRAADLMLKARARKEVERLPPDFKPWKSEAA
jgi:hypothetical protein